MAEHMMINDVLRMSEQERAALTDAQILDLAYGIRWASPGILAETTPDVALNTIWAVLDELRPRLHEAEARKRAERIRTAAPNAIVGYCSRCNTPLTHTTAMNASLGLACPDCYDALSN